MSVTRDVLAQLRGSAFSLLSVSLLFGLVSSAELPCQVSSGLVLTQAHAPQLSLRLPPPAPPLPQLPLLHPMCPKP